MPPFEAYHGIGPAEHQGRFDDLSARGFRMISLCIYGPPAHARYAAVWVQLPGPEYFAFHGRTATEYQGLVITWKSQGYAPVLLSVTGGPGDAIFAGVFERTSRSWRARHGISATELDAENAQATADGLIIRELCCYGNLANPVFAAIWHENPSNLHLAWWRDFDGGGHQQIFDAVTKGGGRPHLVITSEGARYHSIFQDDEIGYWTARHGINEVEYQTEFDTNFQQGRMPISVRAFGNSASSSGDVYNAVFASDHRESPRFWTATGTHHPKFQTVEDVIHTFMEKHRIHAAALAIGRAGDILCSRGFTLAEAGYPTTASHARFRLASLSKIFAAAAIRTAFAPTILGGNLHWRQIRIFPFLGITSPLLPGQTADARINTITLGHLIDHQGGWNRDTAIPSLHPALSPGFDPCSGPMLRLIARDLGLTHVVSKMDVARYMFGEPLQFTPGTSPNFVYSNLGYLLLGLAVEKKSGLSFIDFLRTKTLAPIGVSDVEVAATQSQASGEVCYHSVDAARSVFAPHLDSVWVSTPYGGLSTETTDSSGGLLASAPSLVRTIVNHAAWGIGPRASGSARIGNMPGTFSCTSSRPNGYDYAILFNGDDGLTGAMRGKFLSDVNSLIDAVT